MTHHTRGFDADAWMAAQEPWTFRAGGQSWIAKPIPAGELAQLGDRLKGATGAQQDRAIRRLLRRAFPWRLSMRWRGDPVTLIMALPGPALQEALAEFLTWAGLHLEPVSTELPPLVPKPTLSKEGDA